MDWSEILALLACAIGGGLGLYCLINPLWAAKLVRLAPAEGQVEGRSEFRATFGGLFFASHAFALWAIASHQPGFELAAATLGAAWTGSGVGRLASMGLDRVSTGLNWFNVGFEAVLGLCLFLPLLT